MGKLIFPIKEMPEAPQDGKVYLRKDSSWIRLNNLPSSVIPQDDDTFNLGSNSKRFKDVYIAPEGKLTVGDYIIFDDDNGILNFFESDGVTIPETNLVLNADSIVLDSTEFTSNTIEEAIEESLYFGKAIPVEFTGTGSEGVFDIDLATYFGAGNFTFKEDGVYLLSFGGVVDPETEEAIITINGTSTTYPVLTFNDLVISSQTLSGTHGVYLFNDGNFYELQSNRYHIYVNEQLVASEQEAVAGTSNDKYMTPLRVAQATEKFAEASNLKITNDGVQLITVTYDSEEDAYLNPELIEFNDGAVVTINFVNTTAESTPGKIIFGDEETLELDVYNYTGVVIDNDLLKDKMLTLIYDEAQSRLTVTDYSFKVYEATGAGLDRLDAITTMLEPEFRVQEIQGPQPFDVLIFYQDLNTTLNDNNVLVVKFPNNLNTTNTLPIYFSISNTLGTFQPLSKENNQPVEITDLFDGVGQQVVGRTLRLQFNINEWYVLEQDLLAYQSVQKDGATDSLQVQSLTPIATQNSTIGTQSEYYDTIYAKTFEGVGEQSYIEAANIDGRTKVTTQLFQAPKYERGSGGSFKDISSADVLLVPSEVAVANIFDQEAEGRVYILNNTSNVTLTVPNESYFPVGTQIAFVRNATAEVEFSNASGVTINSDGQKRKIKERYSSAALIKVGSLSWLLIGNLTA
jgi:hypothetical protein